MTIRIYALAKDLNVDSKALIDLCQRLGVVKNGNALTNLTDNNVAKIKAHLGQIPPLPAFSPKKAAQKSISVTDNKPSGCQKGQRDKRRGTGKTVRLYSLAKEFEVESKILIDVCRQLGIIDKASALTNLTEDDVAKIKAYLEQQSRK